MRTTSRLTVGAGLLVLIQIPGLAQGVPANLQAKVPGPTTVELSWSPVANASDYVVQRAIGTVGFVRINSSNHLVTYTDQTAPAATQLRYRIKTLYPSPTQPTFSDAVTVTTPAQLSSPQRVMSLGPAIGVAGRMREAVLPTSAPPAPADPTGFTATLQGSKVMLSWQPVAGILWYLLGGPGLGPNGQQVQGTSYQFDSPGPGQHEWTVASLAAQDQGPINYWVNWPKASLSIENLTGRYRVSVASLSAEHETLDDFWQWDGKRDEVYVSAFAETFDRLSGQLLASATIKSPIHGDINGFPPGSRVRAGSASDLGGIRSGDQVSPVLGQPAPGADGYPLLVLWEGTLTSSREVVVLHPVLWEADQGDRNTTAYNAWVQDLTSNLTRDWNIPDVQRPDPQASSWFSEGGTIRLGGTTDAMQAISSNSQDRPIGLRTAGCTVSPGSLSSGSCGVWIDHLFILTRERIERALNNPYGSGERGLVELRLTDYVQGADGTRSSAGGLQGDYVVRLKIERVP
jgi:hypothetical protein